MDLELTDKVAIVTGASRGIGREVALTLAREGMHVALVARDHALLDSLKLAIEAQGRRAIALSRDLRQRAAAQECIEATTRAFGRIDLLVNNAGDTKRGDFFKLTDDDWALGFELKMFGYVRMSRAAWPALRQSAGSIVNIIGSNARAGNAIFTIGGSANAALVNFTKSLADLGVNDGVRVNAINPGVIATERFESRIGYVASQAKVGRKEALELILNESRIKRAGESIEVADLVAYLASKRADYIQGVVIDIDGGLNRAV